MKKYLLTYVILALCILSADIFSQRGNRNGQFGGGTISGTVLDKKSGEALPYVEIIVFAERDSTQLTGGITNNDGKFEITGVRPGRLFVEVFFIGYEPIFISDVRINRQNLEVDLGTIEISSSVVEGNEVIVEGVKPPITYQIDKKVISVEDLQTAISGSAVDVLENVPSITVDINGNVSLRGSSNFRVLIDGRPSILDASDALQQIPATSIDDIEIITNPSAKYDPEGTSGLINIVMKKNQKQSHSALLDLNAGVQDQYGANLLLDFKRDTYSFTLGANYNRRFADTESFEENRFISADNTVFSLQDGISVRGRENMGVRGSVSYFPNNKNTLTFDYRIGDGDNRRDATTTTTDYSTIEPLRINGGSVVDRERSGTFLSGTVSYERKFSQKEHRLYTEVNVSRYNGTEFTQSVARGVDNQILEGQQSTEDGPFLRSQAKLDYTKPLGKDSKFETGYMGQFLTSEDETALLIYNTNNQLYEFQPEFNNLTDYNRSIHAAYLIFANKYNNFGYQIGLRGEYTDRLTTFGNEEDKSEFPVDRTDFFPSASFSYQFAGGQQFMAGYSRRIERPRGWFLEPFITYVDKNNVRSGNPAITPEYIDAFEAGYQTFFGKSLFSIETYYRIGNDRIERIRELYTGALPLNTTENVILTRPFNVGTDYALGTELMLNMDVHKKWNVNLLGNFFDYRIEGVTTAGSYERSSFTWNMRFNNMFKITPDFSLQLNSRYNSGSVSSQGEFNGSFTADLALRHDFLQKQLTATLQFRDMFDSQNREQTYQGDDFYTFERSNGEWPAIVLNLRYNFNNFKQNRNSRGDGGGDGGDF